jgi:hypothetical protein
MRVALLAVLVALCACTSQVLDGYVGRPIEDVLLEKGPPDNLMDMADGRRAYQWRRAEMSGMPIWSPNMTSVAVIPYSTSCVDTVFASRQGLQWVVVGFHKPTLDCE